MPGRRRADSISVAAPDAKRLKKDIPAPTVDYRPYFSDGLFDEENLDGLSKSYSASEPFLHVVVDRLMQDDLLKKVRDECLGELSFTEKETDIYKVHQTGDLASLSYLAEAQIALLPNLLKLRDALYSQEFRGFLRKVTGCGPLSGKKQDMSVNSYKKGCHLLNHDDVIGTRRVSYILYMPTPEDQAWKAEWGGALELYPVKEGENGIKEPEAIPSKSIPPSWNQFTFFEVQPGHSFHSVEEIVVGDDGCERQRLSISGWFHRAQEGEEGYEGEVVEQSKSSLEQLSSSKTTYTQYPDLDDVLRTDPFAPLTEGQISFLSAFLDPVYLQPKVMDTLSKKLVEESSLECHSFLSKPLAHKLENGLREQDVKDGLDSESRGGRVPSHTSGIRPEGNWRLRGPPHKARYCSLNLPSTPSSPTDAETKEAIALLSSPSATSAQILQVLEQTLFPSKPFRTWLALVTQLLPTKYAVEAKRFRPGLDYTLATSNNEQSILDVVLGLTPDLKKDDKKGKRKAASKEDEGEEENESWETGEWGGWECYMAAHEGDEDPAVYRSGSSKKDHTHADVPTSNGANGSGSHAHSGPEQNGHDADEDDDEMPEDDEDGTLLTVQPGFNRLMLALRDVGVMRFTKYVSAAAPGSVWGVFGEYEVHMTEEVEDDEDSGSGSA